MIVTATARKYTGGRLRDREERRSLNVDVTYTEKRKLDLPPKRDSRGDPGQINRIARNVRGDVRRKELNSERTLVRTWLCYSRRGSRARTRIVCRRASPTPTPESAGGNGEILDLGLNLLI